MNPVAVESSTNVDTAREKVLSVLEKAQEELDRITDPVAKERRRAELATEFWRVNKNILDISKDEKVVQGEEGLLAQIIRHFGQMPGDYGKEADRVANKMTQNIEAHVFFNDVRSDLGKIIFNKINQNNNASKTMVLLYPIVNGILQHGNAYLTFVPQGGQPISEFEAQLRTAIKYDKDAFNILADGLITAVNNPTYGAQNLAQLGLRDPEGLRTKLKEITSQEKTKLETGIEKEQKKRERGGEELKNLLGFFEIQGQEELQRLAKTLYSEKEFVDYINELFKGGENEGKRSENANRGSQGGMVEKAFIDLKRKYPDIANTESLNQSQRAELNELACKYFSDEFNERMRRMIGELHRSVDEKDFRTTWQEAAQGGNPFYNINSLMKSLENRINSLKDINIEQFEFADNLKFFVKDQTEKRIIVEESSKYTVDPEDTIQVINVGGKAVRLVEKKRLIPVNKWTELHKSSQKQVNWGEYIVTVQNSIKTEIGIRKFLHDARALPFLTVGHDESYQQMLQKFAAAETDSTLFDSFHTMYDAPDMDAAAKLKEKNSELAFARENWIFKSLLVDYNLNTGRNKIDDDTFAQLDYILGDKSSSERNRIFAAGIGSTAGLDLTMFTGPSQADPAMNENGTPNFASFGERDTALYSPFNLMTMNHHRWGSESSTLWGLLYLPIESDHLKEYFQNWDFNKLIEEQQKFVNSFIAGKNPKDIDENKLRLVDIFNIGKAGSIYDRSGWRSILSYEGWLVQEDAGKIDITNSWKALENIGIEPLKDFITRIGDFNSGFFSLDKNDGTPENQEKRAQQQSKRRELFDYIYRKYFVAAELNQTADEVQAEMDKKFAELEEEKAAHSHHGEHGVAPLKSRSSNYKSFFYQTLTHAMVQRMPTKFIRSELERTRKVSGLRHRAWDTVFDMAKNDVEVTLNGVTTNHSLGNQESLSIKDTWESPNKESEAYFIALQDIIAGEVMLRKKASETMREEVDRRGGDMHKVNLEDTYNLTPERLEELWKADDKNKAITLDEDPQKDRARKLNALAVLKATRKYLYTTKVVTHSEKGTEAAYLDDFAKKYEGGFPFGPGFALANEELAKEFIAHRAAGENVPRRAFGDNVRLEKGVVQEMSAFFTDLYEVGTSHAHSFEKLVKHIKTVRETLDAVHGQDLAHQVSLWMATTAISLYKINSKDEILLGGALSPYHSSLISFMAGGHTEHIWEWDRVTIREFMESLILAHALPREPYSAQLPASYENLYEVDEHGHVVKDEHGNPKKAVDANNKDRVKRKQDFHHYAENLAENFLQNPLREVSMRLLFISPLLFIMMIISMIIQAYKNANGKK